MMADKTVRVLIAEDSILASAQLCEVIVGIHPNITCSTVSTQDEAIAAIAEISPQILVLDIRLSQGTGFGVLKSIAEIRPKPIVVVLTNFALPQYREFALLSGADYFLDKALCLNDLPIIIAPIIESILSSSACVPHTSTPQRFDQTSPPDS